MTRITGIPSILVAVLVVGIGCQTPSQTRPTPAAVEEPIASVVLSVPPSPLVALRVLFLTGAADDPPGKEGLAALTAALLAEGATMTRTWSETLDRLYPLAARIDVYGDKDTFVFSGLIHRDNLEQYADLLAQQILAPAFDEVDFRRHRQDAIDFLAKTLRGNNDEELGKQVMGGLLYPDHPYRHPSRGTLAGLQAITLDDVWAFYRDHFTRDRLIVGVAGGHPSGFIATFTGRFNALPARGRPRAAFPPAPGPQGRQAVIVKKPAIATAISIGAPIDITRADDDFYPLTVARSYLGEHRTFHGLLMNEMRGKRGLNYGNYAYIENFIQDGYSTFPLSNIPRRQQHFEIWIRPVAPHNAGFAIRQALFETERLIREGIPEEGFQSTRRFLMNHVDLWAQDISQRLGYAIDARIYGRDVIAELKRRLPTMTKADVDAALARHLSMDNLAIAIVAPDADDLRETLTAGRATPIVYDTEGTDPAVLKNDARIEAWPIDLRPENVSVTPVDQTFAR